MGITFEVFRSGELKAIGEPVPLSESQRTYLQQRVDEAGATFRANVKKYRSAISPEDMQGQWFNCKTAAQRGFVSGCAPDIAGAIKMFQRLA